MTPADEQVFATHGIQLREIGIFPKADDLVAPPARSHETEALPAEKARATRPRFALFRTDPLNEET